MFKVSIDVVIDTTDEQQAQTAGRLLFQACKDKLQKGPCASKITVGLHKFIPASPIVRPEQVELIKSLPLALSPTPHGPKVQH
jgi:hypothetical protein